MRSRTLVVPFVAGFLTTAASGAEVVRAVRTEGGVPRVELEQYRLNNGLQVILSQDRRLPQVAFNLQVHVGGKNEAPGQTGFAHLFEHLVLFSGTGHLPRGTVDKLLESVGATDVNGTTELERTNYFFTVPSSELELGLWIQSDRLGYLLDEIDEVALANQKDVVRNERRQRIENQPYGMAAEAVFRELFPPGHPFRARVLGSHADIQAATLRDVKAFFKSYYRPNNATLVLVGDFDPAVARRLIEKYFGPLAPGAPPPPVAAPQPRITSERRLVIPDRVELPRVTIAWHTPAAFRPGDAELDLAAAVLARGRSSRLYRALVYDKQIAQSVDAGQWSLALGGIFMIEATARPGHTAAELERAIDQELSALASAPPSAEELKRALAMVETSAFENLEKVRLIARDLQFYNQLAGDPGFLPRDVARYRAVKPEAITRTVAAQLGRQARVVIHAIPGKQDLGPQVPTPPLVSRSDKSERESVNAAEPWRAHRPRVGRSRPLVPPAARSLRLPNGLTVVHVPNPGVPLVSAILVVKNAGHAANPPDHPGLADFTAAMLAEGTASRSATQLADDIATLGASLGTRAHDDDARVSVTCLTASFPAALGIVADVVLHPAFTVEEVERRRKRRLASLLERRQDPSATARVVAAAALFGPGHPLGWGALGDEASIKATSRDDLPRFWRRHYRPDQAALVVAGDIAFDELAALARARLGAWKVTPDAATASGPQRPPATAERPAPTAARVVLVDNPGAAQTALAVVSYGPRATHPDVPALPVMNAILGGNFTSRINQKLREQKGYTYGIGSYFVPGRDLGKFVIDGSVRTDVTGPAVADLFAEIDGLLGGPVLDAELKTARSAEMLSLSRYFDVNEETALSFAKAWSNGQGLGYFERLPARLARVDARAVGRLARKHVRPADLIVVAVGDGAKIAAQLAALRKPIEVRNADGYLVSDVRVAPPFSRGAPGSMNDRHR